MRNWNQEERQKQSILLKTLKPWLKSTGPKTVKGKNTSKMNAYKHGRRDAKMKRLVKNFSELKRQLTRIISSSF